MNTKYLAYTCSFVLVSLLSVLVVQAKRNFGIRVPDSGHVQGSPRKIKPGHVVPANFTWADHNGTNYLTQNRNQMQPIYCGSCWAHAATHVLNDRIKINRNAAWPDIYLSPQVLVSWDQYNLGCDGGWPLYTFKWIMENGVADESCSPYQARGHTNGLNCSSTVECMNCDEQNGWYPVEEYKKYFVQDYGFVSGEAEMMEEISAWGPIACTIACPDEFMNYTSGVFIDHTGARDWEHVVELVGYGEENGIPYWHARNSFGTHWGDNGFFKIIRGIDNLAVESNCSWASPRDTWSEGNEYIHRISEDVKKEHLKQTLYNSIKSQLTTTIHKKSTEDEGCRVEKAVFENGEKVSSVRPHQVMQSSESPANFDWRNVNGTNYLSWTRNQNNPNHCSVCWAEATTACIADRINIKAGKTDLHIALSPQMVINCRGGGSCKGGNPAHVYEFAHSMGIPDVTCMNYEGRDSQGPVCDPFDICRNCDEPVPRTEESGLEYWWTITEFKIHFVSEYGHVQGVDNMKAEIFARGPISCGLKSTPKFEAYKGGIYSESTPSTKLNHEVALVGWGVSDQGQEYWIGRNSWGTNWGEQGFFKIDMHSDNLGINTDCTWGVPVTDAKERQTYIDRKNKLVQ